MYIVAIAWLYIALLMAATETSVVAGVLTLLIYGVAPLSLFLWLVGTPARRRAQARRSEADLVDQEVHGDDGHDAQSNQ